MLLYISLSLSRLVSQVKEVLQACQKQDATSSQYEYEGRNGCRLPEWNGLKFMNAIRNRKLAFVGDSILVNMFASLECLLGTQGFISRVERGRVGKLDDEANTLNGKRGAGRWIGRWVDRPIQQPAVGLHPWLPQASLLARASSSRCSAASTTPRSLSSDPTFSSTLADRTAPPKSDV